MDQTHGRFSVVLHLHGGEGHTHSVEQYVIDCNFYDLQLLLSDFGAMLPFCAYCELIARFATKDT